MTASVESVEIPNHLLARERLAVGGDRPFLLEVDDVWLVAAGSVDVFAVRLDERGPVGPRMHLVRVVEGRAMFGRARTAGDRWGLLAVGTSGGEVIRVSRAELEAGDPRTGAAAVLIAQWVDTLYAAMARDKLPAISIELPLGGTREVGEGQSIRVREELAWVTHVEGFSRLMGSPGLELGSDLVPVSRRAWFAAGAPSRLVVVGTQAIESGPEVWRGLDRLHDLVSRFVEVSTRDADAVTRERMRQRGAYQQALLRETCEHLASTMDAAARAEPVPEPSRAIAANALENPLLESCRMVGWALGLAIKPDPRTHGAASPRDPLAGILHASRVRSRRVALRGHWWTEDSGPLLAFRAPDRQPVALLRDGRSHYRLHDPSDRSATRVEQTVAEGLEPFAYSFYRPFPDTALRMRDVLRFALRGSRRDSFVVVATILCAALVGMVPAIATGVLFNSVIPGAQRSELLQMTGVLLACAGVNALFAVAQSVALLRIETRASAALQAAVWDRLLFLPLPFFRNYTSGDLASRAMAVDAIRQVASGSTVAALVGGVIAMGNVALMFWYSAAMARWATLILGVVLLVSLAGSWVQLRPQQAIATSQSKLLGLVLQLLTSISKLRVAAAEVPAFALWVRQFSVQRRLQYKARVTASWLATFHAAVPLLSSVIIFGLAFPLVTDTRELQIGDFMAFLTAFTACLGGILTATPALMTILNTMPLYEQATPILKTLPEVVAGKSDPGPLSGDVEIQHATFRYQADGPLILRDVSVRIQSGEFVAFVGPSGSGKSTLLRLLLGFEALEGGAIFYDGQELGGLDVQAVRRQMGVVLQSGRLMSGDIYTNIVGASSATLEEAWTAARMAGLAEEIEAMPMGMHTVIREGGGTLSGGQRQRLLIARAIVARPRILLFDEATSALDNRTQAIVSASLESLQATRIVVAHRLSTIVNAHRIFVMEGGQLVQTGTYAELMAVKGPFAELAKRQIA
ncbi:MAG TPA: NHLP bacteriocin export ABC transporter permease/ATPase subunit [Kofleriaceae bacterium]|nr:NHLP bacteriocin export ABC transporter permease/ATPase subunit [Kofleriaceae bacterium]